VCNIQNYWVFGLHSSSGILKYVRVFVEYGKMDEVQKPSNSEKTPCLRAEKGTARKTQVSRSSRRWVFRTWSSCGVRFSRWLPRSRRTRLSLLPSVCPSVRSPVWPRSLQPAYITWPQPCPSHFDPENSGCIFLLNVHIHLRCWTAYRPIATQRLSKHIPAGANANNNRTSIAR
jgi:hypothetical protein